MHKIRVSNKTITDKLSHIPDSGPGSDSELYFLASHLRQYQHDREGQGRLEELELLRQ